MSSGKDSTTAPCKSGSTCQTMFHASPGAASLKPPLVVNRAYRGAGPSPTKLKPADCPADNVTGSANEGAGRQEEAGHGDSRQRPAKATEHDWLHRQEGTTRSAQMPCRHGPGPRRERESAVRVAVVRGSRARPVDVSPHGGPAVTSRLCRRIAVFGGRPQPTAWFSDDTSSRRMNHCMTLRACDAFAWGCLAFRRRLSNRGGDRRTRPDSGTRP